MSVMKIDFITWIYIVGACASSYFLTFPPLGLYRLSYIFLCLMIVFLLLIAKRMGHLTRKAIVVGIFCCIFGCLFLYFLGQLTPPS